MRSWALGPNRPILEPNALVLKKFGQLLSVKESFSYLTSMILTFTSCKMDIILPAFQRSNISRKVCVMLRYHGHLVAGSNNYSMRGFKLLSSGAVSPYSLLTHHYALPGGRSSLGCIWARGQYEGLRWPPEPLTHCFARMHGDVVESLICYPRASWENLF